MDRELRLKLSVEDLSVASFPVEDRARAQRGTVRGNSVETEPGSDSYGEASCGTGMTCWTCEFNCNRTFSDGGSTRPQNGIGVC